MKNIARWTVFTVATTVLWLAGGFCYLVLSRLYAGLQTPTIMLTAMFVMASASAIAAITYAAKLDEREEAEAAALAAKRARGPAAPGGRLQR